MNDHSITNSEAHNLKSKLARLPINAHLTTPSSQRLNSESFPGWSQYDFAFDDYMNIGTSDCQIVCNETPQVEGFINNSMARDVLCAMYKQKAIIMLHVPVFADDVDDFSKSLIHAKLDKIYICDLLRLDATDLYTFLREISKKVINYSLTNYDFIQIRRRVYAHLRQLQA